MILFAVSQALMLYTHAWGDLLRRRLVRHVADHLPAQRRIRENLLKDAILAYVGAGVLFLPWLPNFLYQATHTAAPWDTRSAVRRAHPDLAHLMGGDRVTAALVLGAVIGLVGAVRRSGRRRTLDARLMWALFSIAAVTLALGWIASQITPAWVSALLRADRPGRSCCWPRSGSPAPASSASSRWCSSVVFVLNQTSYARSTRATCETSAARSGRCCTAATW